MSSVAFIFHQDLVLMLGESDYLAKLLQQRFESVSGLDSGRPSMCEMMSHHPSTTRSLSEPQESWNCPPLETHPKEKSWVGFFMVTQ